MLKLELEDLIYEKFKLYDSKNLTSKLKLNDLFL